mmetsp:Transcript_123385/g.263087  ORF Transcript_123385/g.263087 Transcript_123385/m.263087 type:complete len:302 (+) Transcript_123385:2444-3349(+)
MHGHDQQGLTHVVGKGQLDRTASHVQEDQNPQHPVPEQVGERHHDDHLLEDRVGVHQQRQARALPQVCGEDGHQLRIVVLVFLGEHLTVFHTLVPVGVVVLAKQGLHCVSSCLVLSLVVAAVVRGDKELQRHDHNVAAHDHQAGARTSGATISEGGLRHLRLTGVGALDPIENTEKARFDQLRLRANCPGELVDEELPPHKAQPEDHWYRADNRCHQETRYERRHDHVEVSIIEQVRRVAQPAEESMIAPEHCNHRNAHATNSDVEHEVELEGEGEVHHDLEVRHREIKCSECVVPLRPTS